MTNSRIFQWCTDVTLRMTLWTIPQARDWRGIAPSISRAQTDAGTVVTVTWWSEDLTREMSFTNYSVPEIVWCLLRLDWQRMSVDAFRGLSGSVPTGLSDEGLRKLEQRFPHAKITRRHRP